MNLTPEAARALLWDIVATSSDATARFTAADFDQAVDRIVAAEMRALLALHPGGSLNYWVSRRADELEHPAVNK